MHKAPIQLDRKVSARMLADPDTPGFVLLVILLHAFGDGVFGGDETPKMDVVELWDEVQRTFDTQLSEEGENKVNALILGLEEGLFWADIDVFNAVCAALYDGDIGDLVDNSFSELSALELMWSVIEMELALDGEESPGFSYEIEQAIDRIITNEQEDQSDNIRLLDREFLDMVQDLRVLGISPDLTREVEEGYGALLERLQ